MATRHVLRLALAGSLGALALSMTACGGGHADTATFCKDASKVTEHLVSVQNSDGAPASASSWKRLAAETAHLAQEAPDEVSNDLMLEQKWMAGVAANGVINESSATRHAGHDFGYLAKHCSGVLDESSLGSASSSTSSDASTQDDHGKDAFDQYVDQVTNEMMNTNGGCEDDGMVSDDVASDDTCAATTTTTTADGSGDVNVSTDDSQYSVDGSDGSSYSDSYDGGGSNNDDGTDQCQTDYQAEC